MPEGLTERPPLCPEGHTYRPDHVIVGWKPCLCAPGHTGHRSYWCRDHGVEVLRRPAHGQGSRQRRYWGWRGRSDSHPFGV